MKNVITALALALTAITSFAQEATPAPEIDKFTSMSTRADVRATLQAALGTGWHPSQGEAGDVPAQQNVVSTRSRADVQAELLAAMAAGWRPAQGEASNAPVPHASGLVRSRADAMAAQGTPVVR